MNSTNDPNRRELANDNEHAVEVRTRQCSETGRSRRSETGRSRQCLVVASDLSRRLLLSQAARRVGWQAIEAADAAGGLTCAARSIVDLAIVDLSVAQPDDNEEQHLLNLVERLADHRRRLVMVCGNHQRPREEVWARQLGVWIYVPGLDDSAYEDGADVVAICSHAAEIVDRWLDEESEELCRDVGSEEGGNAPDGMRCMEEQEQGNQE